MGGRLGPLVSGVPATGRVLYPRGCTHGWRWRGLSCLGGSAPRRSSPASADEKRWPTSMFGPAEVYTGGRAHSPGTLATPAAPQSYPAECLSTACGGTPTPPCSGELQSSLWSLLLWSWSQRQIKAGAVAPSPHSVQRAASRRGSSRRQPRGRLSMSWVGRVPELTPRDHHTPPVFVW